jgi:hypothetical protein
LNLTHVLRGQRDGARHLGTDDVLVIHEAGAVAAGTSAAAQAIAFGQQHEQFREDRRQPASWVSSAIAAFFLGAGTPGLNMTFSRPGLVRNRSTNSAS